MENQVQEELIEIDILDIFRHLRKYLTWIIICGIIGGMVAGITTKLTENDMYESTSKLFVQSSTSSFSSLTDLQFGSQITNDYMELVTTRPVVESIIEELELDMTYDAVVACVEFTNSSNTRVLKITVTLEDPKLAKRLANAFARATSKQVSEIMGTTEPVIVEKGKVAERPLASGFVKNIILGIIAGAALVVCIALLLYFFDDRLKSVEDIERKLQLNILGLIPVTETDVDGK